jgi:Predicted membrane protein
MGLLSWIILGLIVGVLAKFFMSGNQNLGFIMTILLGIGGALVGGYISTFFGFGSVTGFNFRSLLISTLGAMLIIYIYGKIKN